MNASNPCRDVAAVAALRRGSAGYLACAALASAGAGALLALCLPLVPSGSVGAAAGTAAGSGLVALTLVLACLASRRLAAGLVALCREDEAGASSGRTAEPADAVAPLARSVLPVWGRHVEEARDLAARSIEKVAAGLASITGRLDHAVRASESAAGALSGGTPGRDVVATLDGAQARLGDVVASLQQLARDKQSMGDRVSGLSTLASELNAMVAEVAAVADQTNLLALNAAIEAARAGEAGRGFAVVAGEVRNLASVTKDTAARIAGRVDVAGRKLEAMARGVRSQATVDDAIVRDAEQAIGAVVASFQQATNGMSASSAELRETGTGVRRDLETLLEDLQFQDRMSQMLQQVEADIARLAASLAAGSARDLDAEDWLASMAGRQAPAGKRGDEAGGTRPADGITFF